MKPLSEKSKQTSSISFEHVRINDRPIFTEFLSIVHLKKKNIHGIANSSKKTRICFACYFQSQLTGMFEYPQKIIFSEKCFFRLNYSIIWGIERSGKGRKLLTQLKQKYYGLQLRRKRFCGYAFSKTKTWMAKAAEICRLIMFSLDWHLTAKNISFITMVLLRIICLVLEDIWKIRGTIIKLGEEGLFRGQIVLEI